jgi:hypothetical protein
MFLYLIIFLYSIDIIIAVGVDPKLIQKFYLFGIPTSDISLLFAIIAFFYNLPLIKKYINGFYLIFIFVLFFIYFLYGILNVGISNINLLNQDVRTVLWLFGGIGLSILFQKLKSKQLFLIVFLFFFIILIVLSSIGAQTLFLLTGNTSERITHPNIYIISGLICVPFIIFIFTRERTILTSLFSSFIIGLYFYFVAYLSATRSTFLISVSFLLLFIFSTIISKKSKSLNFKKTLKIFSIISIVTIGLTIISDQFDSSKVSRILTESKTENIVADSRFLELLDFFQQTNIVYFIFGKGIGGGINSSIYDGSFTSTLHIGILNVWMKFGFIPFLATFIFILQLIYLLIRSTIIILKNKSSNFIKHYIQLAFISSLFPWIIGILISGGFGETDFMMLGFVWFLYKYYYKNEYIF